MTEPFERSLEHDGRDGHPKTAAVPAPTVRKIAKLARLAVTDEEVGRLSDQLSSIVGFVSQLSELDTSAVEPLAHPLDMVNVFRPDDVRPSLDRKNALAGAPKHDGECFLVPPVLGED